MIKKNCQIIIGVDEVGRGPLAGPVVACAFTVCSRINTNKHTNNTNRIREICEEFVKIRGVRDSKKLSAKKREEIFEAIKNCPDFVWAIGEVSEKMIDKINILQATKLAMQKAVTGLNKKIMHKMSDREKDAQSFENILLLIDGNMKFEDGWFACLRRQGENAQYKSIIKGDEKIFEISAASIMAKVYRDKLMDKMHKKYPQYGFEKHKGYGTKLHYESLAKHGPCKIHRKTFIKNF